MRGFRDRDYVQTKEGYFFCVIGHLHPEDCVIAYLKYVPDPSGKWSKGELRFRRTMRYYTILNLLETLKFLEHHQEYLYDSPVMGIKMSAVPLNKISAHLKPEEKFSQFTQMRENDDLQLKAVDLVALISDDSGVPFSYFGVTGSLLLDIHQDFSDIDLVVYGIKNGEAVKNALIQMYHTDTSSVRRFDKRRIRQWCIDKTKLYPLTFNEAKKIFEKKWNRGLFHETMFSIHPVRLEEDVSEKYGDKIFKFEGMVRIEARVSDAVEAEFLPAVYNVEDVKVHDGPQIHDVYEVTSYEGLYCGIAEKNDKIMVYGKLEKVADRRKDEEYHRVLVGSKEAMGKDYIKPM
ncbi:MAG: hypothetical protein QXX08_01265 [Candidatus Bathyarchaeia archaeon]